VLPTLVRLTETIPDELITIEGDDYVDLTTALENIKIGMALFQQSRASAPLSSTRGKSPVTIIRDVLSKCPDEGVAASSAELTFIDDTELRDSIRLDLSSSHRDLINGEWKGATVLAGSAIEALLLWVIKKIGDHAATNAAQQLVAANKLAKQPNSDLEWWNLTELIEVALKLDLIQDDPTAVSARLCKNFRNLIHPGRARRIGTKCSRATALTALGAAEHVVDDLSRN
jgi:hypothetical protein